MHWILVLRRYWQQICRGCPRLLSLLHNMIRCVMKEKPMPSGCRKQGWRLNTNAVKE